MLRANAAGDSPARRAGLGAAEAVAIQHVTTVFESWLESRSCEPSLEDSANLPEPYVLAKEMADDLCASLGQIEDLLEDLQQRTAG